MIPSGYKQTEIGIIPEDWDVVPLLDKAELLNGLTYTPENIREYGLLVMRSSNVQNGKFDFRDNVYVDCAVDVNKLIKKDDILICVRNGSSNLIGKCAKAERDYNATFGAFMAVLRGLNNNFIFYLLQQGVIQKHIAKNSDSTINQITNGDFKQIMIPYPKNEMERSLISDMLSDMDKLISSLEKLIAKKKAIKQGAMQDLLTGKRRLPGFNGEWGKIKFGDTNIQVIKGQIITKSDANRGVIPVIAGGKAPAYYTDRFNRNGKTITISASGASAGFVNMYDGAIFASDCSTISESEEYSIAFVYYLLLNLQNEIYSMQTGGAQPHIHPNDINSLNVFYINDIKEQIAIASVLSDMDNEIEQLEKDLSKYKKIKSGMMSELLTGRIRLI